MLNFCSLARSLGLEADAVPGETTGLLNFQNLARSPVGAALAANTGGAGAMHCVEFFAGQARSHSYPAGLRLMQYLEKQLACSISRI
ncbi:hypothetical protein E8E68_26365 [Pseudomonas sp. BN607]|nr:hypothetical protein [Pseudomonas sp. BN607]